MIWELSQLWKFGQPCPKFLYAPASFTAHRKCQHRSFFFRWAFGGWDIFCHQSFGSASSDSRRRIGLRWQIFEGSLLHFVFFVWQRCRLEFHRFVTGYAQGCFESRLFLSQTDGVVLANYTTKAHRQLQTGPIQSSGLEEIRAQRNVLVGGSMCCQTFEF